MKTVLMFFGLPLFYLGFLWGLVDSFFSAGMETAYEVVSDVKSKKEEEEK